MDSPIRGRTRELTHKVEATVPMNIHNRFDIEVIDSRTGKIRQRAQAENVICSQLWTRLFTPNSYFNYIHYGTGAGTPATNNTALFTFLGYGTPSTSDDVYTSDILTGVYSLRRKIQLSETTAVGSTITEVGIGYSTTAATLCTHAMLKDANGNQISIAKTSTDIINIYATVFVHINTNLRKYIRFTKKGALFGFAVGMGGSALASLTYYGINLGSLSKSTSLAYSLASKTITATVSRLITGEGNFLGITQTSDLIVSPDWFSGSSITGEAIGTGDGTTKDFATDFGLVKPGATIYVDGVAAEATVDTGTPIYKDNLIGYLHPVDTAGGFDPANFSYPKSIVNGTSVIFYNPYFETIGITSISPERWNSYVTVECSNDLSTWATADKTNTTPYKNYKYWKVSLSALASSYAELDFLSSEATGKNIHFATPPASGAVITADYATDMIAKDTNHVFDLVITYTLGEYTP